MSDTKQLRPRDEALALALARGFSVAQAAALSGVSVRTAYRRLEDQAFSDRVDGLRSEIVARTCHRLSDASLESVRVLRRLLRQDSGATDAVRLAAAKVLLELALKYRSTADLEGRLDNLERIAERLRKGTS